MLFRSHRVILSLGYKSEIVTEWVQEERKKWPFQIEWLIENEPLGTGGAIKLCMEKANTDTVCVLNGDSFFSVDLVRLYMQHRMSFSQITLALKPMREFDRYGTVHTDDNHVITSFTEKGYCDKGNINGGVYLIQRNSDLIFSMPEKFSFEKDLLEKNVQSGLLRGFSHDRYFIDIGVPEDYDRAEQEFSSYFK